MKLTALIALLGFTEANRLRQKSTSEAAVAIKASTDAAISLKNTAKSKRVGGHVNWRSAREIMDTFDVDGNGTIWQRKEFKRTLAIICDALPYEENPCYD